MRLFAAIIGLIATFGFGDDDRVITETNRRDLRVSPRMFFGLHGAAVTTDAVDLSAIAKGASEKQRAALISVFEFENAVPNRAEAIGAGTNIDFFRLDLPRPAFLRDAATKRFVREGVVSRAIDVCRVKPFLSLDTGKRDFSPLVGFERSDDSSSAAR